MLKASRLAAACSVALGMMMLCAPGQAAWPERPIQVVVPFGAGGDTDFNARQYAKYLQPVLGVSLAVVNVEGGGGSIGARKAKDSAPDGNTVLFFHDAMMVNTATKVSDFSWRDFEFAAIAGREAGTVFCVLKSAKWKTLKELMADSKANPNKISIAGNIGATTYLVAQLMNQAGAAFNIVNHGGSAQRLTALLGGHVHVIQNPFGTIKAYVESGEIRALATTAGERNEFAKDIPTVRDEGFDVAFAYNYFFLFPKGTPKDIVEKFTAAVEKVATTNKDYAAEIAKAFFQKPLFKKGAEGMKEMEAQEKLVNSVKLN